MADETQRAASAAPDSLPVRHCPLCGSVAKPTAVSTVAGKPLLRKIAMHCTVCTNCWTEDQTSSDDVGR